MELSCSTLLSLSLVEVIHFLEHSPEPLVNLRGACIIHLKNYINNNFNLSESKFGRQCQFKLLYCISIIQLLYNQNITIIQKQRNHDHVT